MGTRPSAKSLDEVDQTVTVGYVLSAAARARHALAASMAGQAVDDNVVHEACVVVSELVTNSVQHSEPFPGDQIKAHWTLRKGVIEVDVTDPGGSTKPLPVRRHVLADSGRGLRIVRALAHEWGIVENSRGRTVWASCGGPSRRRTR